MNGDLFKWTLSSHTFIVFTASFWCISNSYLVPCLRSIERSRSRIRVREINRNNTTEEKKDQANEQIFNIIGFHGGGTVNRCD